MFSFGIKIIILLLVIGGITALIGDYIGRVIGRKRLTILNIRPRWTAYAVTAVTGILIVFMTLGIILIISQDARTALFGLDELRKDLTEKSQLLENTKNELSDRIAEKEKIDNDLTSTKQNLSEAKSDLAKTKSNLSLAQKEIASLQEIKKSLKKEVEASRKGKVLFEVGEILLTSLIQAGPEKEKLELGMKQVLSAADAYVRSFGNEDEKHLIFISPQDFNSALSVLQNRQGENILMVIVTRNSLVGEEVPVKFDVLENKLVFKLNQEIAQLPIAAHLSIPEVEKEIKQLLLTTNQRAKEAGILPGASGTVGSVPYSEIYDLANKIKNYNRRAVLKTVAKKDIYSIGPLEIDFKIFYQ
jgi:uncharacterized protein (DUF3084 family)